MRLAPWRRAAPPSTHRALRFDAQRELEATAPRARFACRRGIARTLEDCLPCVHFAGVRPEPVGALTLRCAFHDDDQVHEIMTPVWRIATIEHDAPIIAAIARAHAEAVETLVVARLDEVIGLLPTAGLHDDGHAADRAVPPRAIAPSTPLGVAAALLGDDPMPLLVVDGDSVEGLVSRDELRHAGIVL